MIYKPGFVIQICRTLLENDCIENALKSFLSNLASIVSEKTVLRIIIFDVTRSDLSRAYRTLETSQILSGMLY